MVPNVKEVHNLKVLLQTKNLVSSINIFGISNENVQDSNLPAHNYRIIKIYIYIYIKALSQSSMTKLIRLMRNG